MNKRVMKQLYEIRWIGFVLPALFFFTVFFLVPSGSSIYYSFTKWDGVTAEFIGFGNYIKLFNDPEIFSTIGNTIYYTVYIVIFQNILGMVFALLLRNNNLRNNIMRTMIFMPYVFSSLVIGFVFKFIFEPNIGAFNAMLNTLHLEFLRRPWLSDPAMARRIIVFVTVWQAAGYTMIINIAGLEAIPDDYYEAAEIDGANSWRKFWTITVPLMAPATTVNVMLCLIGDLQIFNQIYALTLGGPAYKTESIAMTIYRFGFGIGNRWGYGSAMSIVMFIGMMILTVFTTHLLRKREIDA
jgi:multiple sugar transport system permease protein/raffinose/stachyose/melibiose transport system permease protein